MIEVEVGCEISIIDRPNKGPDTVERLDAIAISYCVYLLAVVIG